MPTRESVRRRGQALGQKALVLDGKTQVLDGKTLGTGRPRVLGGRTLGTGQGHERVQRWERQLFPSQEAAQ